MNSSFVSTPLILGGSVENATEELNLPPQPLKRRLISKDMGIADAMP